MSSMTTSSIECPRCKLTNPAGTEACDCGHQFGSQLSKTALARDVHSDRVRWLLCLMPAAMIAALLFVSREAIVTDPEEQGAAVAKSLGSMAVLYFVLRQWWFKGRFGRSKALLATLALVAVGFAINVLR